MSRMTLRPHHALCAQFFVGKGYSAQFVEHMKRVLSELDRGADVTLTDGCDAICAGCPNNRDGVCETDEKVRTIDRRAIEAMGITFGDTLPWHALSALAKNRIIAAGALPEVCRSCEWIDLCTDRENAAQKSVDRSRATEQLTENMIAWAINQMGNTRYAGWCLSFIEDALEIGNGIEIFGGDSAKESTELYRGAMQTGRPPRGAFVFYDCLCPGGNGPVNHGHCGISLGDGRVVHAWDKVRIDGYLAIGDMTAVTGDHPKYIGWVPLDRVIAQRPRPDEA